MNTQKIRKIEDEIDSLTFRLKRMSGSELEYGEIWDKRVDLKRKLYLLSK
jgi:hypothetical protein